MQEENITINDKKFTVTFATDKEVVKQRVEDGLAVLLITYIPNRDESLTQEHCENIVNDMYQDILTNVKKYINSKAYEDYTFTNKMAYNGLKARNGGFQQYVNDISFAID
ncbi:hypothetical protein [Flavobacterium hibernum]|uniref:Uncharacterized protein n=1 Tax=Flavobacterium hibernum TaxID=37752 RepID=A0A0D0EJD5_9FLAO|nr:hypothetical protein [Flavobacterium hibernum]KIO50965.1 hypothetical protein IW18_20490 [Flavobacterium hibernum]OXA85209.1 hypothetical protein B0A73_17830 [Flavobacterium hibernum]STO11339.1 Uncharacterised protein [Flavobacterium hibernum]